VPRVAVGDQLAAEATPEAVTNAMPAAMTEAAMAREWRFNEGFMLKSPCGSVSRPRGGKRHFLNLVFNSGRV
jgi:hypothetical protein